VYKRQGYVKLGKGCNMDMDNWSLNLNEQSWSTGDIGMRERMIPTNVVVHFWQRGRTK